MDFKIFKNKFMLQISVFVFVISASALGMAEDGIVLCTEDGLEVSENSMNSNDQCLLSQGVAPNLIDWGYNDKSKETGLIFRKKVYPPGGGPYVLNNKEYDFSVNLINLALQKAKNENIVVDVYKKSCNKAASDCSSNSKPKISLKVRPATDDEKELMGWNKSFADLKNKVEKLEQQNVNLRKNQEHLLMFIKQNVSDKKWKHIRIYEIPPMD